MNNIKVRYYLYGCKVLMDDIKSLLLSISYYERNGATPSEILELFDLHQRIKAIDGKLSYSLAIHKILDKKIINVETDDKKSDNPLPF